MQKRKVLQISLVCSIPWTLYPFIGPVEIRGKKIKKYIFLFSLLSTGRLNFAPFRVSTNTHTRNYRRRLSFAMKPIANERRSNFSAGKVQWILNYFGSARQKKPLF